MSKRVQRALKRCLDVLVALVGVFLTSPIWLAASVAIILETGRPVFYRSRRMGKGGKVFHLFKFRSMVKNADQLGSSLTRGGDARVTSVGRVLRRWKIDELPNLINVLSGEMSLVGPRPESPTFVEAWSAKERALLLSVRPGVTDPAAAFDYRDEQALLEGVDDPEAFYVKHILPEKMEHYVAYVEEHPSIAFDCRILLRTAMSVLFR